MNTILWWLAENTLAIACLLPLVWLLCRLLRHRPAEQHLLWLLLLIKLLTPPIFPSPFTLPPITLFSETVVPKASPPVDVPPLLPSLEELSRAPVDVVVVEQQPIVPVQELSPSDALTESLTTLPIPEAKTEVDFGAFLGTGLFAIWITGCVIASGLVIRRVVVLGQVLQGGAPASDELDALVQKQAFQLQLKDIHVQVVSGASGPFIACLGRPCLIWPQRMSARESIGRSAPIIAHELAHLKRRDHYVAWLELIASIAWWWNPLFRLIRRRLHETREMACDAMALNGALDGRRDYAELLLEITSFEKQGAYAAPAFGAGNIFRGSLQRRLEMVFNEKANGRVTTSGLLLVVMLGVLIIPRWTIGQVAPPSVTPPATAAEEPAAPPLLVPSITTPVPAPTIEAAPPSSATAPAADPVPAISAATAPSPADSPAEEPLALVKVQLADGQSMLHLGTTEDGMLSIEIERDGKIVERHLLPLAVQRADNRARAARRRTITVAPEGGAAYPPSGLATRPAFPSRARTTIAADPNATPQIVQQQHPSTVPAPQGIRYSVPSVNVADLDLLKLDCELAQVTVEKRKVELDEAKETETRSPGTVPATKIKLLELSIREAELELRKCQLKLESASRQQERQAEPEAARR